MLAGLGAMAVIATRDPGFALERDYYAKAVAYDRVIAQRGENARLGWLLRSELGDASSGGVTPFVVSVRNAGGPVTGARVSVEALRNASAQRSVDATLAERAPGEYSGELALARGGLWELRLTVERGRERFTAVERRDVAEARP
jgi:nitrogen fixation protein FixH